MFLLKKLGGKKGMICTLICDGFKEVITCGVVFPLYVSLYNHCYLACCQCILSDYVVDV